MGRHAAISGATIVFAYLIIGYFTNIFLLFSFIMKCSRNAVGSLANLLVLDMMFLPADITATQLLLFIEHVGMRNGQMGVVRFRCVCK